MDNYYNKNNDFAQLKHDFKAKKSSIPNRNKYSTEVEITLLQHGNPQLGLFSLHLAVCYVCMYVCIFPQYVFVVVVVCLPEFLSLFVTML